jgi:hypothetical protein
MYLIFNHAPTIDFQSPSDMNLEVNEGDNLLLSLSTSDSDGDLLSCSWHLYIQNTHVTRAR